MSRWISTWGVEGAAGRIDGINQVPAVGRHEAVGQRPIGARLPGVRAKVGWLLAGECDAHLNGVDTGDGA
jgi:hypothetical protein